MRKRKMALNVSDLLNFGNEGSSRPIDNGVSAALQPTQTQLIQFNLEERRNSFDNNPFDRAMKQMESYGTDPFELVSAQSLRYSFADSSVKTANLIDINQDFNKENNNNDLNQHDKDRKCTNEFNTLSLSKKRTNATKDIVGHEKNASRRDSLLRYSLVNSSKSTMVTKPTNNFRSEAWVEQINRNDSFNDIMKQEINLVDSDNSDFEFEFNIPMLKQIEEKFQTKQEPLDLFDNNSLEIDTHNFVNEKTIAKLNEIKSAHSYSKDSFDETVNKLKEMVNNIEGDAKTEASQLLERLCTTLSKKSEKHNELSKPPNIVRQDTFDIDQSDGEAEHSNSSISSSDNNSQVQTVIDQLSKALGNISLNVLQTGSNDTRAVNPVVVVVVNSDSNYGMSDTITLNNTSNDNTPPKAQPRRSQSFSSNRNSGIDLTRKVPELYSTPQRAMQPKRRSFSFNTPNTKSVPLKRPFIMPPSTIAVSECGAPSGTEKGKKLGIIDKIKPKLGFNSNNDKKSTKQGPLKATVPIKTFVRQKSPDNRSVKSLPVRKTPAKPIAASTPLNRNTTPQKPLHSRISFLTPTRSNTRATSTVTTNKNTSDAVSRRRSFNDKDKSKPAPLTSTFSIPRPTTSAINSGNVGTLTQRKFAPKTSTATSSIYATKTRSVTTNQAFKK